MADELFDVRISYVMGNFHHTIAEGNSAKTVSKKPEDIQAFNADRDGLVALAQIGLGQFDAVLADLRTATHPYLVAVRHYAQFQKDMSLRNDTSKSLADLTDLLKDASPSADLACVAILASSALMAAQDVTNALKLAATWANGIDAQAHPRQVVELRAIVADGLLRLNRPDLAEKETVSMKAADDESIVTFITTAAVCLKLGATKKEKYAEAEAAVRDAAARSSHSVSTLNILALALVGQGKLADAERCLLDALSKKSGDPDTIANLVMVASQMGKPAEATLRYINQVKASAPTSTWVAQYSTMENRFAEAAQSF